MCKRSTLLVTWIGALLAGCASHQEIAVTPLPTFEPQIAQVEALTFTSSYSLMYRDVSLSLRTPRDSELQMRLVSIAGDSTTSIRLDSGEVLAAKPTEFYSCSQFGKSGLQLISASHDTGVAVFRRKTCESR
jgi:hypothetical protein